MKKTLIREKTTAILLIAIFMISTLVMAIPVSAAKDADYKASCNLEKIWGATPDVVLLSGGDSMEIEVWGKGSTIYFIANIPTCYNPETSYTTFTFDVEPDGLADFQIQWDGTGWVYSPVVGTNWLKWLPVPTTFTPDHTVGSRTFTLRVPISILGGFESDYKLGVQACRPGSRQIFFSTHPAHLWYDATEGDYAHSTYYVPLTTHIEPPRPRKHGGPTYYDGVSMGYLWNTPHKLITVGLKDAPIDAYYYLTVTVLAEDFEPVYSRTFYVRPTAANLALYLHESTFPENYSVLAYTDLGSLPYLVASRQGIEINAT